ncbi:MAG: hypothetical protein H6577_26250 [Lewinellaceae bacterium]|nr:hypothetical protein [Lewinellaceae bacterium]
MKNSQSPSIHSIYQNALPFYLNRTDICAADEEGKIFAVKFFESLLQEKLAIQLNASSSSSDKLRHLYFESRNLEKTFGPKTLGFGFPLLIDTYEGELFVSPLFIWLLSIEPAQAKVDAWILKFSNQSHLLPNFRAANFLKEKYDLDLTEKMKGMTFGRTLNGPALQAFCQELADRLHFEKFGADEKIIPCPGIDEIGNYTEKGAIHWSGVLSIFPPQDSKKPDSQPKPEDVFVPSAMPSKADDPVFPFLPADPEQVSALEIVEANKVSVVEGVDSLGKTQTLINLIIHALACGKKCLVVSERAPALKHTQKFLANTGLIQLHFLLDDALNDKMPLLELMRVAAKGGSRTVSYNAEEYQAKKNKFAREKTKLDAAYGAVKKKVFGDYNWTETVGLFLASNRVEGKELLTSQLNGQDFKYNVAEYESFKNGILTCHPLFQKVKTLSHPLGNLHDQVFQQPSAEEALHFVKKQLRHFLDKTSKLQHRFIGKIDSYGARLREHYRAYFEQMQDMNRALKENILAKGDELGNDFREAGSGYFKLYLLFSTKKKKIAKAQEEVGKQYQTLVKTFTSQPYFDFQFQPCKDGLHIPNTLANIEAFGKALNEWHSKLDSQVQEEVMRLNSKTAHPSLDVKEQITELEYSLDVLLEELNEANLYQKNLENKTLTIPQRQKYLESIIEQLENTQLNLRDFDLFFQWQSSWLALGPMGQKVVRALVKVKPDDWMAAFESWYFNNLLTYAQMPDLPAEEALVKNYAESWHALRPLILPHIQQLWQSRQEAELKELRKKDKKKYQLIFEKNGHQQAASMPLGDVLQGGYDAVSAFLPVLFTTPHVAMNMLPVGKGYFDYVILEEANRFSVETATALAPLGKQIALFGSNDSNGGETSILQYALENEVAFSPITNLYHVPARGLSALLNPNGMQQFPNEYLVESAEGRFHEIDNTNDVEAQHIIRQLNQVKQTPQRVYPTVGIVAFTVEQRDLIANYLLKLKQQNAVGSEKIQQLERNGMGVFFIDELFGQHFDILILSCTFGTVNLQGSLTKKIIFLNTPEGISQVKMLINKPVQQLQIIHSFSEDQLEKFRIKQWEEGTWLLANFIQLAEAMRAGNTKQVKHLQEMIGKVEEPKASKSLFTQEVINALRPYFDEKRFVKNKVMEDVVLPLCIKPQHPNGQPLTVHPDGFFADTNATSGLWEQQQRDKLASAGFSYLPVWSLGWFKNPSQEARLLASKIIKLDSSLPENEAIKENLDVKKEVKDKDGKQ